MCKLNRRTSNLQLTIQVSVNNVVNSQYHWTKYPKGSQEINPFTDFTTNLTIGWLSKYKSENWTRRKALPSRLDSAHLHLSLIFCCCYWTLTSGVIQILLSNCLCNSSWDENIGFRWIDSLIFSRRFQIVVYSRIAAKMKSSLFKSDIAHQLVQDQILCGYHENSSTVWSYLT